MGKKLDFAELVEVELSASGVDRFVKPFDYSDQEWAEIESSAQWVRTDPLTEDVRTRLRRAGEVYLTLHSTGREFLKQQELTSVVNWENIHGLAAALYEQLGEANARRTDDRRYRQLLKSLAKLRDDASVLSVKSPPLPPREDYYREILGVWVDKLGGELGVSRETFTHKLGGPLVKFFRAVTGPVLASEAPALETISDIVDREKERRKMRRKRTGQAPAKIAEYIEEPAPSPDASGLYTDLGPFRADPDIPFDKQVHNYLVARGRATGVRHIVAIDADGSVLAHGFGTRWIIGIPKKLLDALNNAASKIAIHSDSACNPGLSAPDIALLACCPGLEAICRHGNGGNIWRGALTPKARAMLRGSTTEEASRRFLLIADGVKSRLYDVLLAAIRSGKISLEEAKTIHPHVVGLTLLRAGILDYRWNALPGAKPRLDSIPKPEQTTSSGSSTLKLPPAWDSHGAAEGIL